MTMFSARGLYGSLPRHSVGGNVRSSRTDELTLDLPSSGQDSALPSSKVGALKSAVRSYSRNEEECRIALQQLTQDGDLNYAIMAARTAIHGDFSSDARDIRRAATELENSLSR